VKRILSFLAVLMVIAATSPALFADSVPRMDKEVLRSLLGSDNLILLDVRLDSDWTTSEFKIKGALRLDDGDLSMIKNYPKDKTIVLYCA
jgi:rhodanese-related sulfurtransferase